MSLFRRRKRYATVGRPFSGDARAISGGGAHPFMAGKYQPVADRFLASGEELLNAGMAVCVHVAKQRGAAAGEGTLLITDHRVLHVLDVDGTPSLDVTFESDDDRGRVTAARRLPTAVAPGMCEIVLTVEGPLIFTGLRAPGPFGTMEQAVSFYVGSGFCDEAVALVGRRVT